MVETLIRKEEFLRQELWQELPLFAQCQCEGVQYSFEKLVLEDDGLFMTIDVNKGEEYVGVFEFFFAGSRILATFFPISVPSLVEVNKDKIFTCFKEYIINSTKHIEVIS